MVSRSTINDVANAAGVSVATVSRALRGLPNVSASTRARVQDAAATLDYAADARASSLASGRTGVIGMVAPDFGSWYTSKVASGVERRLAHLGLDLLVYSIERSSDRFQAMRDRLKRGRIDGLILVDFHLSEEQNPSLGDAELPMVTLGETVARSSAVVIDNFGGGRVAANHLCDLGHRDIAFVGGRPLDRHNPSTADRQRCAGVQSVLDERGGRLIADLDGGYTIDGGRQALRRLTTLGPPPTAVVCASDEMAFGVVAEARSCGAAIPTDLSVVGFDGHDLADALGLTTIAQPVEQAGATAVDLLWSSIEQGRVGASRTDATSVQLPLTLCVRATTGTLSASHVGLSAVAPRH